MLNENELKLSRNQEQEKVFFIIYQALFQVRIGREIDIVNIIEETMEDAFDNISVFVKETSIKVLKNYVELKNIIEPNCVNWKFNRINLVLIAILMLGIGEYKYVGGVDKAIIIDICVKLAKKYGDEKDYRFVNALLDKVL